MNSLLTNEELINYSKSKPSTLIVIDFSASWCIPCREIKPFIQYLQDGYPNVEFKYIDIEDETTDSITTSFKISKVPTFVYFKNGETHTHIIGTNKSKIEELINEYL